MRFTERGDIERRVVEFFVPGDFLVVAVVAQRPDLAGFPIGVDVRAVEFLEA